MAHFAKLDENNKVIEVIVVSNDDILDENGNESEEVGIKFCRMIQGENTNWKQTSYNGNFREKYAGIGMYYDQMEDKFIEVVGDEDTITR
jgi:hypothetical protein